MREREREREREFFLLRYFKRKILKLREKFGYLVIKNNNNYQNIFVQTNIREYLSGNFNKYHTKFCLKDKHLNFDTNKTRYRNYNNCKFANFAINNNQKGSFLSIGVSFGTSLKLITHLLDSKVKEIKYYIVDNYSNYKNDYNTNINYVKNDLIGIKNFKPIFIEEFLNESSIKKINNDLIFTHLNTGNFKTEFKFLPKIIKKTKIKGTIMIDNYGFFKTKDQKKIDYLIDKNKNLFRITLPSLQLVLIKF